MPRTDLEPLEFQRMLRRDATDAESRMWRLLRNRQLGAKFRRQHRVGPYVLDFFCVERQLAIELDGGQHFHDAEVARDAARTRYLRERGIRVVRFTNLEVLGEEQDAVLQVIWNAIHANASPAR